MREPPVVLLRARLLALFLIALAAAYTAMAAYRLAWTRHAGGLLLPPLFLGAGTLLGASWHDRLSLLADRVGRGRVKAAAAFLWFLLAAALLVVLTGQRSLALDVVVFMMIVQPFLLLLSGLGRGHQGTIVTAFSLTVMGALEGGPAAAAALTAHAGLVVLFLAVDHPARMLTEYPVDVMPSPAPVLARATALALAVSGPLAGWFVLSPPEPYAPFAAEAAALPGHGAVAAESVLDLLLDLGLAVVAAGLVFWLLLRYSLGRGSDARSLKLQRVAARRRPAEPRPPAFRAGELPGWRGRVVKLYVRILEQLAAAGLRRRPGQTPLELAPRLEPRAEADVLTDLFMRARYGPSDLTEEDFERARRAGAAVVARRRG